MNGPLCIQISNASMHTSYEINDLFNWVSQVAKARDSYCWQNSFSVEEWEEKKIIKVSRKLDGLNSKDQKLKEPKTKGAKKAQGKW